jgi:hypothetical protein
MDAARFDSLAKTFTAALTRRRALTGLIGAGFSTLLRVPHGAAKPKDKDKPCKKDKHCTAGQRCCAGACVDLQTDPKNFVRRRVLCRRLWPLFCGGADLLPGSLLRQSVYRLRELRRLRR